MIARSLPQHARWKILAVAAVAAYSGPLAELGHRLWQYDYFRFYPVFLVAVMTVTIGRMREAEKLPDRKWRVEPLSFAFAFLLLTAALWFWSPWLGAVSALLLGDSLLPHMVSARQSWRLLFLLIPLPLGLDERLVHKLQRISSEQAGWILDFLNVPHLMRGNVLELADRRFFVAEACSGISSVYLMLAATALYIVLQQMRLIRAIPLLLSVVWWAIVTNDLRIVSIALAHQLLHVDLATGWQHEALGVTLMLMAFGGIWTTRCLLDFLLGPIGLERSPEDRKSKVLTPMILWDIATTTSTRWVLPDAPHAWSIKVSRSRLLRILPLPLFGFATVYWGMVLRPELSDTVSSHAFSEHTPLPTPVFDPLRKLDAHLFDEVPGVSVREFSTSLQGAEVGSKDIPVSSEWKVSTPSGNATLVVSGPFFQWPQAHRDFLQRGWRLEDREVHSVPGQPPAQNLVTVRLLDEKEHRKRLHFATIRPSGELVTVPRRLGADGLVEQLQANLTDTLTADPESVLWQLQFLMDVPGQSVDTEVRTEHHLFGQLLQRLQDRWRERDE